MLRTFVVGLAAAAALAFAGCSKKPAPTPPVTGGAAPVKSSGASSPTGTGGTGTTEPVGGHGSDPADDGWVPIGVPEDQKNVDDSALFRVGKAKNGAMYIENVEKGVRFRVGHVDIKTEWELVGGDVIKEVEAAPNGTDMYFRVEGKRTMDQRWNAPPGKIGERQAWTFTVGKVLWKMPLTDYFLKTSNMEEDLLDTYLSVFEKEPTQSQQAWKKLQADAISLGFGLMDKDYDPAKKPFQNIVSALDQLVAEIAEGARQSGGVVEATALLNLSQHWAHFPPCPVSGDKEPTRLDQAKLAQAKRVKDADVALVERVKSGGINLTVEELPKLLSATDTTLLQRYGSAAAEAGRGQVAAESAMLIFLEKPRSDPVERKSQIQWQQTTLSLLKVQATASEKFFADWPEDALLKFPGRFFEAVKPFANGKMLIPSRNAVAVLEAVRKAKPGAAFSPSIDDIVAELKKK